MPEEIVSLLYEYLKPGGTLLVFEHVRSDYSVMRFFQTFYTIGGWRFIMNGCELNRPTLRLLLESGKRSGSNGWKDVEMESAPGQGWWSLLPMIIGELVKS